MKAYITIHALMDGAITVEEGEANGSTYLRCDRPVTSLHPAGFEHYYHGDWAPTEEKALKQAKRRRGRTVKKLRAEIARLEALEFRIVDEQEGEQDGD